MFRAAYKMINIGCLVQTVWYLCFLYSNASRIPPGEGIRMRMRGGAEIWELAQAWGVFGGFVKCVGGDLGDEVPSFACVLAWLLLIVCNEVHRQVAP